MVHAGEEERGSMKLKELSIGDYFTFFAGIYIGASSAFIVVDEILFGFKFLLGMSMPFGCGFLILYFFDRHDKKYQHNKEEL